MLKSNTVHDKIVKQLVIKYNLDDRVINAPTRHMFKFINDVISNPEDNRAIRLPYLGVFTQKNTINKVKYYSQKAA